MHERPLSKDDIRELAEAIPKHLVRFERFPNAGHGVFREAPARFLRIVRKFITSGDAA
jgi:pimeloyl-ACP methyl ester carboxylesterase